MVITNLGIQTYSNIFERRVDPRGGRTYYWLCGDPDSLQLGDGLDTDAIRNGPFDYPLKFDATDERTVDMLREWDIRL